jgi:hypothetical protein
LRFSQPGAVVSVFVFVFEKLHCSFASCMSISSRLVWVCVCVWWCACVVLVFVLGRSMHAYAECRIRMQLVKV